MSDATPPQRQPFPSPANEDQKLFYLLERDAFLSRAKPMLGELARRYLCEMTASAAPGCWLHGECPQEPVSYAINLTNEES